MLRKKAEATCFSFADEARKNVKTKTNGSNTSCIFHLSQIIVIERRVVRNLDFFSRFVINKNFFRTVWHIYKFKTICAIIR